MPGLQLITDEPTPANQAAYANEMPMWSQDWQLGGLGAGDPAFRPQTTQAVQVPGEYPAPGWEGPQQSSAASSGGASIGSQVAAGIQAAGSAFKDVMSVIKPTTQVTPQPKPVTGQSWFSKNWQLLAILGGTAAVLGLLTIALKRDGKGR